MRKTFLFIFIIFLSFSSVSLLRPHRVSASDDGGPAGKFMLKAVTGPKTGEVTLAWIDAGSADNYHLVYGTDSKNMQFGALNIGTNNVYTVGKLTPGIKYYFALVPVMNSMAMYTSEWVAGRAMGSAAKSVTPVTSVTMVTPAAGPVGKHWLVAKPGPHAGEVTLTWRHADDANNYHLVYGTQPGNFKYGVLNIGWINSYTVSKLVPGQTYYFALVPVKNDTALYTADQVSAAAKMNVQIVQTTREAIMQPKAGLNNTVSGQ